MTMTKDILPISTTQLRASAPAALAYEPASYINQKRYNFVSTMDIIDKMNTNGWLLTSAKQSKSRDDLRKNYGTHFVTFQHPDFSIADGAGGVEGRPTIVFMNSHDGSRPLQAELGIFRLVCENGLIVKSMDFGGFKERHTKLTNDGVKQLIDEKANQMQGAVENINRWSSVEMKSLDMRKFATDALLLRIGEDRQPDEYEIFSILESRREADNKNTLWHTYNRVQENLIKGGFALNNREARAINNPIADMTLNQGLWQLAEKYAN